MRVLAIAEDAGFLVSLSLMAGDWEVVSFAEVEQAVASSEGNFSVAIIDLRSTERGLLAAESLRDSGRHFCSIVVGDEERPLNGNARVLVRPFTLDELVSAVKAVLEPAGAPAFNGRPRPAPPAPPPSRTQPAAAAAPPAPPAKESPPSRARAAAITAAPKGAANRPVAGASPRTDDVTREPEAGRPRRGLTRQSKREPGTRPAEAQPRRLFRRSAAAANRGHVPAAELLARLDLAARGMREAVSVLEEMPFLADPDGVAAGVVAEIAERFSARTVALYVPQAGGSFEVLASHGLSGAEQRMSVPADHPLLAEVGGRLGSLLLAPVEMAQGLVAGIAGSRTDALMAAPLPVGGVCEGMAIVGSHDLADTDLDALVSLAAEAAPGLALARWLGRLASSR